MHIETVRWDLIKDLYKRRVKKHPSSLWTVVLNCKSKSQKAAMKAKDNSTLYMFQHSLPALLLSWMEPFTWYHIVQPLS